MARSRHRGVTGPTEKQRRGERLETLPPCTRGDVVRHCGTASLRVCQARTLTSDTACPVCQGDPVSAALSGRDLLSWAHPVPLALVSASPSDSTSLCLTGEKADVTRW